MKKVLIVVAVVLAFLLIPLINFVCGWVGEAVDVVKEEVSPREIQRKYEWFKDIAATCDEKRATIQVYAAKLTALEEDYDGVSRREWDRTDKETMSLWQQEVAGIKASYNILSSRYNAQMSKWNWRFCEIGSLPEGAFGLPVVETEGEHESLVEEPLDLGVLPPGGDGIGEISKTLQERSELVGFHLLGRCGRLSHGHPDDHQREQHD